MCIFLLQFPPTGARPGAGCLPISLLGRRLSDIHPHSSSLAPGHPRLDFPSQTKQALSLEQWWLGIILAHPVPTLWVLVPFAACPDHSGFLWNGYHSGFRGGTGAGTEAGFWHGPPRPHLPFVSWTSPSAFV